MNLAGVSLLAWFGAWATTACEGSEEITPAGASGGGAGAKAGGRDGGTLPGGATPSGGGGSSSGGSAALGGDGGGSGDAGSASPCDGVECEDDAAGASGGDAGAPTGGRGGETGSGGATPSGGSDPLSGGSAALGGDGGGSGDAGSASPCDDVECQAHAKCVENGGEAECRCRRGYESDDFGACVDVDECQSSEEPACGFNANCKNEQGAFGCVCPEGFTGDPDVLCCAPQPPEPDASSIVLLSGHIDGLAVAADCDNQVLSLSTKDSTIDPVVYREPERVLIHASENAAFTVPEGLQAGFEFLGAPGSTAWLLPMGQPEAEAGSLPWLGFDAAAVSPGLYQNDEVTLYLSSVEGPGRFVAFESPPDDSSPPHLIFDPDNDLVEMEIAPGLHRHLNWFFSEPGLYRLHLGVEATRAEGGAQTSTGATLRIFIGDLAELPETEPTVLTLEGFSTPYFPGDTMVLSAERHGAELPFETTWLRRCLPDDWTVVGHGDTLSYAITELDAVCQFRAAVSADGSEHTTSQVIFPTPW